MPYFGIPIRNGLPIGLGSVAGFGVQQFSPADLFSTGEQGAWYDPSDFSTLFTDSAGTTPVTAVEQFVGRMNDKSGRGNHATQTTSAKRPKLAARYNLLTYSEQFDNAAWTKGNLTVSANAAVAPDGTTTADKLNENTANAEHYILQTITAAATQHTASVYLKAAERTWASVYLSTGPIASTWFNLAADGSGGVGTVASGVTATSQYVGNGWYRCSITRTTTAATWYFVINPALGDGVSVIYAGTLNSGILAWGADLRPASQATGLIGPTYQRVVDAATYDAVGFLPYLQFDGLSWSMSTNSIDFSAGDKMTVWAGVRKLSNAAQEIITELSSVYTNAGAFAVGIDPNLYYSALTSGLIYSATYSAPITNILAVAFDKAASTVADEIRPRINSVLQQSTILGANSSGNFGNHSLFIGARNNATAYLNGQIYSLIVRGAQSTQGQIEATESWVNGKTGAY